MGILDFVSGQDGMLPFNQGFKIIRLIDETRQKLLLAELGGFVSRMNFEVLAREYEHILEEISAVKDVYDQEDIMDIQTSDLSLIKKPVSKAQLGSGKKDNDSLKNKEEIPAKERKIQSRSASTTNERQRRILEFLEHRGWLNLTDILPLYGEAVSTKTVQRDLNALLIQQSIKSVGEKRWRRYAALTTDNSTPLKETSLINTASP